MRNRKLRRARYRVVDGKHTVELKLRTPHQLFDERDPSPFRERDLDDDAARYIHESFSDLKDPAEGKLYLVFETLGEFRDRPNVIVEAIHAFYRFELDSKRRHLRKVFRQGTISLFIGVTFLFMCTTLGKMMLGWSENAFNLLLREGLAVMGWVAMWKPISVFLYEWWPITDEMNLLGELADVEVDIRSRDELPEARRTERGDSPETPLLSKKSAVA